MSDTGPSAFNRRSLGKSALLGSAAALFSTAALGAAQSPPAQELPDALLDGRRFGATGDGRTDDTAALQRAFDAAGAKGGGVFLPPGVYLTGELHVRPGIAVIGIPAWNYSGAGSTGSGPGSGPGGSVLRLAKGDFTCLLNLTEARGATIDGLALDGGGRGLDGGIGLDGGRRGRQIHGISVNRTEFAKHEDAFRIERCQVMRFSGDGLHFDCVWCFSVRHSMVGSNRGDGLALRGWDGFILDNWFSGNGRAGFAARHENASITFTANRIEWNHEENMLVTGGDGYQITGNFFDRAGLCGLALRRSAVPGRSAVPCTQVSITGNFIKRSGRFADADTHDSSQIVLDGSTGVTCVGNVLQSGRDDGGAGVWSPSYGIMYQGLEDCVIANNVLYKGALRQLLVDLGGQGDGVVIKDNPGRLFQPGR
jgi:hypothetical protein